MKANARTCIDTCFPLTLQGEERKDFYRRLARGEDMSGYVSPNAVKDVPPEFKKYVESQHDSFVSAGQRGKLGYIWQDNKKYIRPFFTQAEQKEMGISAQAARHVKTEAEKADIQRRWEERKKKHALIKKTASNVLRVAKDYGEVNFSQLQAAIDTGNLTKMQAFSKTVAQNVSAMKRQETALANLIPNVHRLHQSYSMSELQSAYSELDGVIKKWLSKYGYSSVDAAPLEHLRNKLDFELANPTIGYSQKEIIKKAVTEKIRLVNQKIEWNDMVAKVSTLQSFKTKSTTYKNALAKIDDAISRNDFAALQKSIADAETQQQKIIEKQLKRGGSSALNKEYKGGATGRDLTSEFDATKMKSEDPYRGTFTNNAARMQGFDAPAKLVSKEEFEMLAKENGDVFFRTVNPTAFKGKNMSSKEFASQLYRADLLELNGPGERFYGDGMYTATSAWDGYNLCPLSDNRRKRAYSSSIRYGKGQHTISEMTWVRKPRIIKETELEAKWEKLSESQKLKFDKNSNTYGCALGYDGMYCNRTDYLVIWNRSIIAVKKQE